MNDIEFGPNANGNYYIAVHYHQKNASSNSNKSRWCITANEQCDHFDFSDNNNICDINIKNTCFFFSSLPNKYIGRDSERIGKFIGKNNKWHGFPIRSTEVQFSETFLEFLEINKFIDRVYRRRIVRGQI